MNANKKKKKMMITHLAHTMIEAIVDSSKYDLKVIETEKVIVLEVQPYSKSTLKKLVGRGGSLSKAFSAIFRAWGGRNQTGVAYSILEPVKR